MSDVLSRMAPPAGAHRPERRLGRGPGSGLGKMSGRGFKGQKARNPGNLGKPHFQGGQTPIQRRLPKRGFRIPFPVYTAAINVSSLERFDEKSTVDEEALRAARLIQKPNVRIKILGEGELTKALTVKAHKFSASARKKIEAAKGTVVEVPETPGSAGAESGSKE